MDRSYLELKQWPIIFFLRLSNDTRCVYYIGKRVHFQLIEHISEDFDEDVLCQFATAQHCNVKDVDAFSSRVQ